MRAQAAAALCMLGCVIGCVVGWVSKSPAASLEIHEPTVEEGIVELELFGTRTFDNNRDRNNEQNHRFELGYGVNSWWKTEIEAIVKKDPGSKLNYDATE